MSSSTVSAVSGYSRIAAKRPLSLLAAGAGIGLVAMGLRPGIVSIGPLLPRMIAQFDLSHTEAALLTAIPTLLMGLLALPAPWLARRFGRDRVIASALAVLAAATLARALVDTTTLLFLATTCIGAGIAVAGALIAGVIKASYPKQVAIMMSVYATALALGSTLSAAVTGAITAALGGWRVGAGVWVIPGLIALYAWRFIARHPPGAPEVRPPGVPTQPFAMPLKNRTAWLIALFFACNNFIFYAYVAWLAPMYVESGRDAADASLLLASFMLAFMLANPVFGFLSRREDRRWPLAISAGIALAGNASMSIAPAAFPLLTVVLIAFGTGGSFTLALTLPLDNTVNADEANAWNAFVLLISYTLAAAGPLLVGRLHDASGSFQPSIWMIVAVGAVMLAVTPFLRPYRRRQA